MTAPTLTFNHGFCKDFTVNYNPSMTVDGQTITLTPDYKGDYFRLDVTNSTGNKTGYVYANTDGALGLPTSLYPWILFRYRTSNSSIKAKIDCIYEDASVQTVLAETPNTGWTTAKVALDTPEILDHVKLYANGATGQVDYDFILVCSRFTFPEWGRLNVQLPNYYNQTRIPSKVTNRNSYMGSDDAKITLSGDIDTSNTSWVQSYSAFPGDMLYQIQHNAYKEPFQWFTSDRGRFKVVIDNIEFTEDGVNSKFLYEYIVMLHEYSRVNKSQETYEERFGLSGVTT